MEKEPDVLPPVEDDVETSDVTEPAAAAAAVASEPVQTEEPIAAEPIAEPVAAEPIIATETTEPVAAESIADPVAEPVVATEGNEDIEITLTSGSGTDLASQNTITITAPEGDEKAWSRDNNSSPDDILLVSDASQLEKPQVRRARSTTVSGTSTVNEQAEDLTLATVSLSQDDSGIPPLSIKLPTPATTAHSSSSPNSAVSPGGTSTNLSAATAATTATTTASAATLTPNSNSGGGFFSKLTNSIRRNSISAEPPSPLMTTAKMTTSLSREELDIDDVLNMDPEEFRKNSEHHNTLSATNSSISATPTDSPETPTIERRMSSSPSGAPGFDGATSPGAATTKRSSTFKEVKSAIVSTTGRVFGRRSKSLRRSTSLKRGEDGEAEDDPSKTGDSSYHSSSSSAPISAKASEDGSVAGELEEESSVLPAISTTSLTKKPSTLRKQVLQNSAASSTDSNGAPVSPTRTEAPNLSAATPTASTPDTHRQPGVFRSVSVSSRTGSQRSLLQKNNVEIPRLASFNRGPMNAGNAEGRANLQVDPNGADASSVKSESPKSPTAGESANASTTAAITEPAVDPAIAAQQQKDEAKRRKRLQVRAYIVEELLGTERNYCQNLHIVLELFVKPLMEAADSDKPIINKVDIKLIFSSIEDLLVVNRGFLDDLEAVVKQWTNESAIGSLFNKHFENSEVYLKFVDNYAAAKAAIRRSEERSPAYRTFVQDLQSNPECHKQGISDHMILPIQRVTRYVMLLADMVKNTEPTHNDYTSLVHAHESMRKFSMEVNEAKRKEESMTQMFHIQKLIAKTPPTLISASRRYVAEYEMVECTTDTLQPFRNVMLFIFTDTLMIARASGKNWTSSIRNMTQLNAAARQKSYKFDKFVPLKHLTAHEIKPSKDKEKEKEDKMLIKVVPEGTESMVFQASSHNDRFLFVGQINENAKTFAAAQQPSKRSSLGGTAGPAAGAALASASSSSSSSGAVSSPSVSALTAVFEQAAATGASLNTSS